MRSGHRTREEVTHNATTADASDDGTVALYRCDLCSIGDDQLGRYAREQIRNR
jgi:hypothetical protein